MGWHQANPIVPCSKCGKKPAWNDLGIDALRDVVYVCRHCALNTAKEKGYITKK